MFRFKHNMTRNLMSSVMFPWGGESYICTEPLASSNHTKTSCGTGEGDGESYLCTELLVSSNHTGTCHTEGGGLGVGNLTSALNSLSHQTIQGLVTQKVGDWGLGILPLHWTPCLIKPYRNLSHRWQRCSDEKLYSANLWFSDAAPQLAAEKCQKIL